MTTSTWSAAFFYVFFVISVRENHGATYYYTLTANYTEQVFTSENYPYSYPTSNTYYWTITAEYDDHGVYIQSSDFSLESTSCSYDYVAAYDGTTVSATRLAKSCGTSGISATSSQRNMLVKFRSDSSVVSTGFQISYKAVPIDNSANVVGIVVGSLVGAAVVITVLVCACKHFCGKKKARGAVINPAPPATRTASRQVTLQATNQRQPLAHSHNQFGTPGPPAPPAYTHYLPPIPNEPPPAYDMSWAPTSSMPSAPSAPTGHDLAYPPPPPSSFPSQNYPPPPPPAFANQNQPPPPSQYY